jgi:hypothetical protein
MKESGVLLSGFFLFFVIDQCRKLDFQRFRNSLQGLDRNIFPAALQLAKVGRTHAGVLRKFLDAPIFSVTVFSDIPTDEFESVQKINKIPQNGSEHQSLNRLIMKLLHYI